VSVAALLGVLWAAVWLAVSHLERSTRDEASATRRSIARSVAELEASSVRAIDTALISLRSAWVRDRGGFDQAVQIHEDLLHKENAVQIAVVDAEGWVRYSRLPQPGAVNFADREYFVALRERGTDELAISTPVMGRITGRWAIQFARPLRAADGRFNGIVVVAVPPPALEQLYRDMDLGPGAIMTLARRDGRILARSTGFDKSVDVALTVVPADSADAGEFVGAGKVDGVPRLVSWRNVPDYPLRVYVGQSVDTVLAPFRQQRRYLVGLAFAASLLLVGSAYVVATRARERARFLEERERLMFELHDGCIQSVYAIGLNLQDCRGQLGSPAADAMVAQAQADLNLVIQDLRAFIGGEPRVVLAPDDFVEEIRKSAPATRAPVLSVDVDRDVVRRLHPEQASHLLRIVREAVSNVVRHAGAAACRITLGRGEGSRVRLDVSDDGRGLDGAAPREGSLGLAHIQARAKRMGGVATIVSAPGRGTTVTVEFPAAP
jgi:signal transduction histidine kinase